MVTISSGVSAAISGVTVTGGVGGFGAGIVNQGALTLAESTLSGNSALAGAGTAERPRRELR